MSRILLIIVGCLSFLTGFYIFFMPLAFYLGTPGLDLMGPFSIHFIRDVGLAYIASGCAMIWGGWSVNRGAAVYGAVWPSLHALFHIQIWGIRGFPFDHIFFFDSFVVIMPVLIVVWAAVRLQEL